MYFKKYIHAGVVLTTAAHVAGLCADAPWAVRRGGVVPLLGLASLQPSERRAKSSPAKVMLQRRGEVINPKL